jgi:uncharacterized protein (TIGR02996 family)
MSGSLAKAFLDDIVANTDDDTPRLVYADWLDEHDQPERAEFIRAQVELERLPKDSPARPGLEDRIEDLLTEFEERWLAPVPAQLLRWTWRRGFLETVEFVGPGSAADMVRLCAAHPLTDTQWIAPAEVLLPGLDMPEIAKLPFLHLSSGYRPERFLEGLAGRQAPANLTGLKLPDADPAAVAALPCAASLTRLDLDQLTQGPDTLADALAAGAWPRLSHLRVYWGGSADARRLRPLFAPPRSGLWRDLEIGVVDPDVLPLLAGLPALRRLKLRLSRSPDSPFTLPPALTDLTCSAVGGEGPLLSALAETDGVERLRCLRLFLGEPLQAKSRAALRRLLRRLRGPVLRLYAHRGCEGFLARLVTLPHLDRVAGLEGSSVPEPAEVEAFFACHNLAGLHELKVGIRQLRASEVRLLAKAPWLAQLRMLDLRGTQMPSRSLIGLLQSPHLRRLTSLTLNQARMNAGALRILEEWPGLPRLRELAISLEEPRRAKPLPLRLDRLSPLAVLHVLSSIQEEDEQRFRARHGRRWPRG